MDRAEAIRHFEYGISHDIYKEPVTSYARMAIAALREQERRCEYCTPVQGDYGYQFGKDFPKNGGNVATCIRWNRDGDATLHSEVFAVEDGEETLKDYSDTPIHRCPMCGRKLGGAEE